MGQLFHLYKQDLRTLPRLQGHFLLVEKRSDGLSVVPQVQMNLEGSKINPDIPLSVEVQCFDDSNKSYHKGEEDKNNVFDFKDLLPNTLYTFKGRISKGSLVAVFPEAHFQTLDGVPDEPYNLEPLEVKQTEVKLSWLPPKKPRGTITLYTLKVKPLFINNEDQQCQEQPFPSLEPFLLQVSSRNNSGFWIDNLLPNTKYSAQVKAHTHHVQPGEYSLEASFVTQPGPPKELKILSIVQNKGGNVVIINKDL